MSRRERILELAVRLLGKENTTCKHLIGAMVVKGNRVITFGICTEKTSPKNPKLKASTFRNQLCAEVVTVNKARNLLHPKPLGKYDLYVGRITPGGRISMAKPCKFCLDFLRETEVENIFFTNRKGEIEKMRVKKRVEG